MKGPKPVPEGETYDCAVIGAGPGGLLSALYLRRFRRSVLVFNSGKPRAYWIPKIHNLIGIERPTSGRRILGNLERQLGELNTSVICENVRVDRAKTYFLIRSETAEWRVRRVILATGVSDASPPLPNLLELRLKAVLGYCPICDGYDHCDQELGLFVDGASGLSKIPFLLGYTRKIHVLPIRNFKIPGPQLRMVRRHGVRVHRDRIVRVDTTPSGSGLRVRFRRNRPIELDFAYVSMGVRVNDQAFRHLKSLKRTQDGFIVVNSVQQTSIPGVYAVGDCVNDLFQVSVASGHAAIAATDVHNSLDFAE